ncbi:GTP-binding protein ERG-like [Zingiber officinale]|uniref:GTP-binding protein ERG-like n=1 Tax=Zingiber officinale TaxID=94328 RepID=UPI001C4CD0A5|nr:GTP-binding protein ERG-like [Zingiber officinale]XP_042441756.1 GTP-binding protein ERG-like [Zingiber officinale]
MKGLRAISRVLSSSPSPPPPLFQILSPHLARSSLSRFFASGTQSQSQSPADTDSDAERPSADFDSSEFSLFSSTPSAPLRPIWDEAYRAKADAALFQKREASRSLIQPDVIEEDQKTERATRLARALLEAALEPPDDAEEENMAVKEEDQRSLSVGVIGAPNAGKSSLTNFMVGTKVAAVSRKTNTTTHEILGVMTKGNTQICLFDTPGLMIGHHGYPYRSDVKVRVESAWSSIDLYDLLIVLFDVHRHLTVPDNRVINLVKRLGQQVQSTQKRVLCMNKVDLVEDKKNLLKVAKEFEDLPGYERYFMISGLSGSGVKDLVQYLMDQAVNRPWDEEPTAMTEEMMKTISLEVVREKMLNYIHQEIPYVIEHRLMDWKELRDGSLRIEQHFITPKQSHRQIIVGKNGSKIGRIGIEANEELRSIFKKEVHLILQVRVARKRNA